MKLEKREITLNEKDSIRDILLLERSLMERYVDALVQVERKEERERLLTLVKETAEEIFGLNDLLWAR